jgi:hypothetical protein
MTRCIGLSVGIAVVAAVSLAAHGGRAEAADNGPRIPFDVAELFFELNDTDGDLGIHALIDGEPWLRLRISDLGGRSMLAVRVQGRLRRQGLTEQALESAEPTFDELPPEEFFLRFPEGTYTISGVTLEGEKLASPVELTHLLPAPPQNVTVSGTDAAENCDADPLPQVATPVTIDWDEVMLSHPDLGRTGEPIEVAQYQVVVAREEPPLLELSAILDPGTTSFTVPDGLLQSGDEIKFEILVREASGNQTALESCFVVE